MLFWKILINLYLSKWKFDRGGENADFDELIKSSKIKNMRKIYFIILVLFVSCSHFGDRKPAQVLSTPPLELEDSLKEEIEQFQELVEEALVWRSKSIEFAELHKEKFKKDNLTHAEMLTFYEGAKWYLKMREKIMAMALRYEKVVNEDTTFLLSPGSKTKITTENISAADEINPTFHTLMNIDPTDRKGRELLIQMKLSLSAALILYDNYMIGIYPYLQSKKSRKMLKEDIPGFHNKLSEMSDNFFSISNRDKIIHAMGLFKADLNFKEANHIETSEQERYLEMLSLQSPFYSFITEKYKGIDKSTTIKAYFDRFYDHLAFMNESFTFIASKIFGNTLGLVAFREGYLKNLPSEEKKKLASELRPLDIMLEKTPFRLTDKFIPGYYGHVAIWIGNEEDLKALDVWNHPSVVRYQKQILAGKRIIEALRPGVEINSLEHFLNIDDLLVLRDNHLTLEQKREFVIRAFEQVGKEYDFNFDVETDSKIVCSEIVYVVFHDIDWPTKKSLGRYTISPDNVASKAIDGNGDQILDPVLLYRSGKRQTGALVPEIRQIIKAHSLQGN